MIRDQKRWWGNTTTKKVKQSGWDTLGSQHKRWWKIAMKKKIEDNKKVERFE